MSHGQAASSTSQGGHPAAAITGRHVLFAVLGFFAVVTGVNGIMIYKALTTFGGVETQDAYRTGLAYNQRIAAEAAQAALGWHDDVRYSEADAALTIELKDRDGQPVRGAAVTATLGRSATNLFDRTLTLSESASGLYRAPAEGLGPGAWIVNVMISRGTSAGKDTPFAIRRRLWLKP